MEKVAQSKFLLVIIFGLLATMVARAGETLRVEQESVPGQYLVELQPSNPAFTPDRLMTALRARAVERVRPNVFLVIRDEHEARESVLEEWSNYGFVQHAEPNAIVHAYKTPNDPKYVSAWGMSNLGKLDKDSMRGIRGVDINAEKAWDITTDASNVTVAIIDTGIDLNHPDLIDNAWTNQAEANGKPGVDDDNNGYIDDIHGYNFVANNGDATDDNGHGTHCAGTIGARGDNGIGSAGVAWKVKLMAIKFLDKNGTGNLANAIKAIDYARINHANILSNSWGGPGASDILKKAVEDTRDAKQLFVVAAGNSGEDNDTTQVQPAGFPVDNIVAVSAVDNRGNMAEFSNYGKTSVQLVAPGVNVFSTGLKNDYTTLSGTSMSAPYVAGVAALVWAQNPNMSYFDVKQRMIDTSRPIAAAGGKVISGGIVDAYFAVSGYAPPRTDPNDPAIWANQTSNQISTPHPYPDKFAQTYTVKIPGASSVAVHFTTFKTESNYDQVLFLNSAGEKLGTWTGDHTGQYSPIADGDTLIMKFTSDISNNDYGFDVDKAVYPR